MKIIYKLILLVIFVSAVPLLISGYWSISISEREVITRTLLLHSEKARVLSWMVNKYITDMLRDVNTGLSYLNFPNLSVSSKRKYLRSMLAQMEDVRIAGVYDDRKKERISPVINKKVRKKELIIFRKNLKVKKGRTFVSDIYKLNSNSAVAVSIPVSSSEYLGVEISMDKVESAIESYSFGETGRAFMLNKEGKVIFGEPVSLEDETKNIFVVSRDGEEVLGAISDVLNIGWRVGVLQSKKEVLSATRNMKIQILYWLGASMFIAMVLGMFLARSISVPINQCATAAKKMAEGDLSQRINIKSRDEAGRLAEAFNYMAEELKKSYDEIKRWNLELQKRVEERTRELKEAHEQLLRTQKMAAVGTLGAGVAHELNNPLVGIIGFTQILLKKKKEGDSDYRALKAIENQSLRMKKIISSLLLYSQSQMGKGQYTKLDLREVVDASLSLIENDLRRSGIDVIKRFSDAPLHIYGDFGQLEQAFLNILSNAKNAMRDGGKLEITCGKDNGKIWISFTDTGRGIPPDIINRIFEPFFTTKENWEGVGLGLAVTQRIVEDHYGEIKVKSEIGKGSTFTVVISIDDNEKLKRITVEKEKVKAHLV